MMNGRGTPEAAHFAASTKRLTTAIASAFLAAGLATGCSIYGNHKIESPRDSKADLAGYLADDSDGGIDERGAVVSDYRGYENNGMPPPSSAGLTVAQILDCPEQFPMGTEAEGFGSGSRR